MRPRAIQRPCVRGGRWEHHLHAVASGEARALFACTTSAVPESIRVRCHCWGLQCGSFRIGSAVCWSLSEVVCVSGILDLRGARIKRKFGTPIQASDRYNTRQQRYEQLSRAGKRDNTSGCVPPFTHDVFAKAVRLALPPMLREPRDGKPTRLLSPCEVLPAGRRSCSWPIGEATWPWSHRAALLSAVYPGARLWG